jgi:hypothetical protein
VGAIEAGVQANSSDPAGDEPGVLSRREWSSWEATAREKIVAGLLPRLLRQFEPDRMSGFLLAHGGPIQGCPMGDDVFDPQGDYVASPQFAVDCQVEHRQVPQATIDLELGSN